jgi:hypothetical protein
MDVQAIKIVEQGKTLLDGMTEQVEAILSALRTERTDGTPEHKAITDDKITALRDKIKAYREQILMILQNINEANSLAKHLGQMHKQESEE